MKILHLNSNYNTSIIYKQLFNKLEARGVEQKIFIPVKKNFTLFKDTLKVEKNTKRTNHIFIKCFTDLQNKLFFPKIYIMYKQLKKEVELKEIDLIHAHSTFSNGLVAYLLKLIDKKKYIVAFRSTDYEIYKKFFLGRVILKKIMSKAEKIIFINYSYKNQVIDNNFKNLEKKVEVIPNGVEDYWINNKNLEIKEIKEKIIFISIGYFIERKKFEYTIQMINKISNQYDVELIIVGEGPLKSKIENIISNKNNIKLFSWQPKEKIRELLQKSDIFILPSLNETFGLIYLEALSQGLSIIYKEGDGIDGFISPEFGFGCTLDIEKDKNKLLEYLNKRVKKQKFNIEDFSWENISKKYIEIYLEVKGEKCKK